MLFSTNLLAATLARQSFFDALSFARLEVEGVTLRFFDNVLLLDFALEPTKGVLEWFALLNLNVSQPAKHLQTGPGGL